MIKIENTEVVGLEHAIRGMRNPMNSWDKSDSKWVDGDLETPDMYTYVFEHDEYIVGDNDLELMKSLSSAGTDHSKFLRMIVIYTDITSPMYWWKEFDTYKVGTVRNSCSTMHKIHFKEFTIDDFSTDHLNIFGFRSLEQTINNLNRNSDLFLDTKDKSYWWNMIQLLPSSYNQKSTVMMNYQVLKNIYHSRKNHKLDEWKKFCKWIESLPYSELITGEEP